MKNTLSNLVLFGDGWQLVEKNDKESFVWSTAESVLFLEHNFEKVEIDIDCFHLNVSPLILVKNSSKEESITLTSGFNTINIDTAEVNKLTLKHSTFIPKNVIENSTDPRELGVRVIAIRVYYAGTMYDLKMGDILSKRYVEIRNRSMLSLKQRSPMFYDSRKFNLLFNKIYCVSTKNDWVRRLHAFQEYEKYGINFEFVTAIDPDVVSPHVQTITKEEGSLCYTTKWCLENAKLNNHPWIIMMEDDFQFVDNWLDEWTLFYQHLPNDWDLLYLGQASWWEGISDKHTNSINDYVDRISYGCGAHFVIIRETIYDLCIDLLSSLSTKVDICYWDIMKDKKYNCYASKKSLANSFSTPSKEYIPKLSGFKITEYFPSRLNLK